MTRWMLLMLASCAIAGAQPAITPDASRMRLDEIGIYEVGYAYRGHAEHLFPMGWSGYFDDGTGVACEPAGRQNGKDAFLLHCPWRNGTGIAFQQFRVNLPRVRRILLTGATAMRSDIVGKSDGATFRIYVNGRKLLDVNRTTADWQPFRFDLTSLGGTTAVIRFETDPGPHDNPSFDFSLWGDRELVLQGYRPPAARHPAPLEPNLLLLRPIVEGGAVPPVAFPCRTSVEVSANEAVFRYSGRDGTMEYRWRKPASPSEGLFGRLDLWAKMRGDTPVTVPLASTARLRWVRPERLEGAEFLKRPKGAELALRYSGAEVHIAAHLAGKSLVMDVSCDAPLVEDLDVGDWGPALRRRTIQVPYLGTVRYLPAQNLFVNAFLDWTHSNASSHDGTVARYGSLTDGRRNPLMERVIYTAAWNLDEVLPNIPNPPSPYRADLADRTVLDIWGGRFVDIAHNLKRLFDAGIPRCVALIHDWQRSGYDNALPMHLPANASLGGDAGMKTLVSTGVGVGYRVALHENYVDYYPNYDFFNPDDIALASNGERELAWYNPGTHIQSFAEKPNAILRLAATQSPEIHRRFGTNADYLDVHSSVPPWFHVDFRATEEGAGRFARVWQVHRALWAYERRTHGGPVFGEGANHWYWSGCLDGVEAQFGVGWPANQGENAPLLVDFDLLRIHPLQLNHGMGYYERWRTDAPWGAVPPMKVLDVYRMQEAVFGHAGFLGASTWNILPLVWLEHHLLSPVTKQCALQPVRDISYECNGTWGNATWAAKNSSWKRVRVTYANGLVITGNGTRKPLRCGHLLLPYAGWLARGPGLLAYTALRNGVYADYCSTPRSVFANARPEAAWNTSRIRHIRPMVASFRQTGPRQFEVTYKWLVRERLDADEYAFVHFSALPREAGDEKIRFQQDHAPAIPTSRWKVGDVILDGPYAISIPPGIGDGDYEWSTGLYPEGGGSRLPLEGVDDGHGRIVLGVLSVRDDGAQIRFTPEVRKGNERLAEYRAHLNADGRLVDFGDVRTNGTVLIVREADGWVLQPMPESAPFIVDLSSNRFGRPRRVECRGGSTSIVAPKGMGSYWRLKIDPTCVYRWRVKQGA
ncbi:MAG: DUF5696 domain-containing protein [Chthonomonadales bacterium]